MKISNDNQNKRSIIKRWIALLKYLGSCDGLSIEYLLKEKEFLFLEIKSKNYNRDKPSYCLPVHNTEWGFDTKGYGEFLEFFRNHDVNELSVMYAGFKGYLKKILKGLKRFRGMVL